jgi:hypothetical protein
MFVGTTGTSEVVSLEIDVSVTIPSNIVGTPEITS